MNANELELLLDNWENGNRKDAVVALLKGKMSDAIEFADELDSDDRRALLLMLRNRDN